MVVKDVYLGIRMVGQLAGLLGVVVEFGAPGSPISPPKLVDRVSRLIVPKGRRVYLTGDVIRQDPHELAFAIGDLADLHDAVVVDIEEGKPLPFFMAGMHVCLWVTQPCHPFHGVKEIVWEINEQTRLEDVVMSNSTIPVSLVSCVDYALVFELLTKFPNWRFYPEAFNFLRQVRTVRAVA